MGHVADLQAAHSSYVTGMVIRPGIQEQTGTTARRREVFWLSSTDWHKFSGLGDPIRQAQTGTVGGRDRGQRHGTSYQLATIDMETVAQRMTGQPTLRFWGCRTRSSGPSSGGKSRRDGGDAEVKACCSWCPRSPRPATRAWWWSRWPH
jgi:hypothetical protein